MILGQKTSLFPAQSVPFRLEFNTDSEEQTIAANMADTNEQALFPGGIIGFKIDYMLMNCN